MRSNCTMDQELQNDLAAFNDTNQENSRKLFVGGLSWETTSDSLRAYMSRYGDVVDCSVKLDVSTGRSRGFGFVMFRTVEQAEAVLKTRPHMLDGKIIDPKRAVGISKSGLPITKKIFVGGVRSETTDDSLQEYFTQFGTVHSLDFPIDHTSSKRRGFCFLEFEEPEAAEKAMLQNFHSIGNQTVEVKPAYTKEQQQALMARGMWPPPGGKGGSMFPVDLTVTDPSSQIALKNLISQIGGNDANQMNGMAAAALFYQTYFQYALAFGASANATSGQNAPAQSTSTNKIHKTSYNQEIKPIKQKSAEVSEESSLSRSLTPEKIENNHDSKKISPENEEKSIKRRTPERKIRKSPQRRISPDKRRESYRKSPERRFRETSPRRRPPERRLREISPRRRSTEKRLRDDSPLRRSPGRRFRDVSPRRVSPPQRSANSPPRNPFESPDHINTSPPKKAFESPPRKPKDSPPRSPLRRSPYRHRRRRRSSSESLQRRQSPVSTFNRRR